MGLLVELFVGGDDKRGGLHNEKPAKEAPMG